MAATPGSPHTTEGPLAWRSAPTRRSTSPPTVAGSASTSAARSIYVPGRAPTVHVGGSIQRIDLEDRSRRSPFYDSCDGKRLVAPDDLVFDRHGGMWVSDIGKVKGDAGIYYALPDGKGVKQVKGGMTGSQRHRPVPRRASSCTSAKAANS